MKHLLKNILLACMALMTLSGCAYSKTESPKSVTTKLLNLTYQVSDYKKIKSLVRPQAENYFVSKKAYQKYYYSDRRGVDTLVFAKKRHINIDLKDVKLKPITKTKNSIEYKTDVTVNVGGHIYHPSGKIGLVKKQNKWLVNYYWMSRPNVGGTPIG